MKGLGGVTTLMFDFYGTVVDMQGGLIEAITPYLESKNYTAQPAGRVVTWWRSTTPWTRSVPWYRRSSAWPRSLKLVILSNGDPDMLETGVSSVGRRGGRVQAALQHLRHRGRGSESCSVGGVVRGQPCVRLHWR